MAQTLEFSATDGMTLTATRCAVGSYTGTAADSVTQQSGTNRYLAVFSTEVSGAYRLDVKSGGTPIGAEVYDLSGSGTFQPRVEQPATDADIVSAVTILPATGTEISRVSGTAIQLFTSELITVAVGVTDSAGDAVDLTGLTLELVFESGATEVVIADADITKTTSSFSFTSTSTLTASERLWKWALRNTAHGSVIVKGTLEVVYAANN